jgi:glycosyltransferase involved in cell wall biosynthesis
MISVCMAIKNGEQFVKEQIDSILPQLALEDELVISDDQSDDKSIEIILSFNDPRIRLVKNPHAGIVSNFTNSLVTCKGDIIFLADQDDIWVSDKIERTLPHLKNADLVLSDCFILSDDSLKEKSFYEWNNSRKGLLRNILRNSYMGCCMAFNRRVLEKALPIPKTIPVHDIWIGLIGEWHFKVVFIPDKLLYHRRHTTNASSTYRISSYSLLQKINLRYQLLKNLIRLSYA